MADIIWKIFIYSIFAGICAAPFILLIANIRKDLRKRAAEKQIKNSEFAITSATPISEFMHLLEQQLGVPIHGANDYSIYEIRENVAKGARFVIYQAAFSFVILSMKKPTDIYFIPADANSCSARWISTFVSFVFGWWGIPFGPIFTIQSIYSNLRGGIDVTDKVLEAFDELLSKVNPEALDIAA